MPRIHKRRLGSHHWVRHWHLCRRWTTLLLHHAHLLLLLLPAGRRRTLFAHWRSFPQGTRVQVLRLRPHGGTPKLWGCLGPHGHRKLLLMRWKPTRSWRNTGTTTTTVMLRRERAKVTRWSTHSWHGYIRWVRHVLLQRLRSRGRSFPLFLAFCCRSGGGRRIVFGVGTRLRRRTRPALCFGRTWIRSGRSSLFGGICTRTTLKL